VCGASATGNKHPETGKVFISVTFGPLGSASAFHESKVTSYDLVPLDDKNRPIDVATMVAGATPSLYITEVPSNVGGVDSTCCAANLHTISMFGTMPTGLTKVMVVAKSGNGASAKTLPWGWTSDTITKSTTTVQETTGKVTLNFASSADAEAAATDSKIKVLLVKAIANSITGVEESDVVITKVAQGSASRRLSEEDGARRLSTSTLIVDYKIVATGVTIGSEPFTGANLLTALKSAATALGATSLSTALSQSGVTAPTVGAATTASLAAPASPTASFAAPHATSAFALFMASFMTLVTFLN